MHLVVLRVLFCILLLTLSVWVFRRDDVDRLVFINPATSFDQSIWPSIGPLLPQIPNELYTGLSFSLAPLLGNPLSLLAYNIDTKLSLPDQLEKLAEVDPWPFTV